MDFLNHRFWRQYFAHLIHSWRGKVLVCVLCFTIFPAAAESSAPDKQNVFFLSGKATSDYVEIVDTIKSQLEAQFPSRYHFTEYYQNQAVTVGAELLDASVIVTVGTAAAEAAYSRQPAVPILSVLITESAFVSAATQYYGSVENAFSQKVSAISLNQPTLRSIKLAKLLVPSAETIGVMLGPASLSARSDLNDKIVEHELSPNFVGINQIDNPINKLEPVFRQCDVFVPLPDSRLINVATAKWILHLSYRYKVPVIAFSKAYLRAGALTAIYSSPENVAMQSVDWFFGEEQNNRSGRLFSPTYFSINFNYSVAAHLGITLEDTSFYAEKL